MPRGVYERNKEVVATDEAIENREQDINTSELLVSGPKAINLEGADAFNGDYLERERFMAEELEVHLHEPSRDDESTHCYVGVNGDAMWLVRGGTYRMKRYHVAALASAKTGRVSQRKVIAPDGSQSFVETEVLSMAYPFSVISDPNPKGGAWLREIVKRAA